MRTSCYRTSMSRNAAQHARALERSLTLLRSTAAQRHGRINAKCVPVATGKIDRQGKETAIRHSSSLTDVCSSTSR
jgi:hypothetical protein